MPSPRNDSNNSPTDSQRRRSQIYLRVFTSITVFVGLAVLAALAMLNPRHTISRDLRAPASTDVYNDEGELVFSEESIAEVSHHKSEGHSLKSHSTKMFIPLLDRMDLGAEDSYRRIGVACKQAREVKFDLDAFVYAVRSPERRMVFNLFSGVDLTVVLGSPSVLPVNQGVYNGVVEGDEGSAVHLYVIDGQISGTIETSKPARYRIVPHPNGHENAG